MKIKATMPIELYLKYVINDHREVSKITESWNLEKDDIISVLIEHFQNLGIYKVFPMEHSTLIYENIIFQLHNSPLLKKKIERVNESIRRMKEKNSRRHG